MDMLLEMVLRRIVRRGHLEIITASEHRLVFGDRQGEPVIVRFADRRAQWGLLLDPYLYVGELFMNGRLIVERGSIYDFLELVLSNAKGQRLPLVERILDQARYALRSIRQFNVPGRAKRNVAHHYDLDERLYPLFLDGDRQYSCAYFEHPGQSLDDAQLAKKRHLTAKLLVEQDHKVLDIGCGWGGLALYIGGNTGAQVRGVTLSDQQFAIAQARAVEEGLTARVAFALEDYRNTHGTFDRIVSVGMFEHVGVAFYDSFFQSITRLMKQDGVTLLHFICRSEGPGGTNPWINKYIFPGGYIPALSEVFAAIERSSLLVTDVEMLRLHYAETLRAWRQRFMARRAEARSMWGETFCRMWEFYLAGSEATFRYQDMMVCQIQLAKEQTAVPLVRDYVTERENALRKRESLLTPIRLAGE
jgi:cyclopropane-fatty-acyl-phospholipid synthase